MAPLPTCQRSRFFLPFPEPLSRLEAVSEVRSTLIASSLQALKTRGLLERYTELLPKEFHDTVLHCIAGQWFPLAVGFAHYQACDDLGLSLEEQKDIGSDVSRRIHETFLGVVVQMAKGVGVTPLTVIEIARLPLLEIPYFRTAAQGIYQVAIGMFAKRAHVRVIAAQSRVPGELTTLHVSWV